jgi:phenylalanyl-tRNA synthetase beta chain
MKILLSWLCEHLKTAPNAVNVTQLINLFNTKTAEIESFKQVFFNTSEFFLIQATSIDATVQAQCPELNTAISMPKRTDAISGKWYLAIMHNSTWRWASMTDFASEKDGLLPAVHVDEADRAGAWKQTIPATDYILEIDNKSINHRPDLWGHYGIAREVSAFLNVPLQPVSLAQITVQHAPQTLKNSNLSLELQNPEHCSRVAALFCDNIDNQDSHLWMAIRLVRADIKPINALVDLTNFVMLDIGHPMHAFDAATFANSALIMRMAHADEKLELLDGQKVELDPSDIVIANTAQAVSLAGVMGGKHSGIAPTTQAVILEAAGFNPLTIRKTAQRLKLRTESCTRFEKHLDPMQNITAIARYMFLAQKMGVIGSNNEAILSVGQVIQPKICALSHEFVQNQLGAAIDTEFIQTCLQNLGFGVDFDAQTSVYRVTIPTWRMTKDIKIQEDLTEEIIRSYGFDRLLQQLPARQTQPFSMQTISNVDHIKHHMAFALHMHELREYLLYDASFIQHLNLDLSAAIQVKNPMSQNWTTLATSLIPHLLKAVQQNVSNHDHLRFFEINNTWYKEATKFVEEKKLSGIIFDKKNIDFYQAKQELQSLFDMLGMKISWKKPRIKFASWYHPYQTAQLFFNDQSLGFAGLMSHGFMNSVVDGHAFIFELDARVLENLKHAQKKLHAWSKFQDVCYDISILLPTTHTIDTIEQAILQTDKKIIHVHVIDFFEKQEWPNQRAITLRYVMNDHEKTMTKQDIDAIVQKVSKAITDYGAQIR